MSCGEKVYSVTRHVLPKIFFAITSDRDDVSSTFFWHFVTLEMSNAICSFVFLACLQRLELELPVIFGGL